MIPISPVFFSRAPAVSLPFDLFTFAPNPTLDRSVQQELRNIAGGFAKGGSYLRVYMSAQLGLNADKTHFQVTKAGVGKLITGTYSQPSTQAVPVPFTFGGAAGFTLAVGQMIESDEIAFPFAPSDKLVFMFDCLSPSMTAAAQGVPNSEVWYGAASMTKTTVTGFTKQIDVSALTFVRIGAR
jgi:hypothetical protein